MARDSAAPESRASNVPSAAEPMPVAICPKTSRRENIGELGSILLRGNGFVEVEQGSAEEGVSGEFVGGAMLQVAIQGGS